MPIVPPSLDDRSYDDLVAELVARIPAHTPEWTNPVPGDPGRTLIELFAWLADTLLYRANLVPERQRLAFLRLLGMPLRPAVAARGLVTLSLEDDKRAEAVMLSPRATVVGPARFETEREITVLPVSAEAYCKRPLSPQEQLGLAPVVDGLRTLYRLSRPTTPYVTTPVFAGGAPEPGGFDLMSRSVDRCLWIALLAPGAALVQAAREALGGTTPTGAPRVLSVGVSPQLAVPALMEEIGPRAAVPHVWEISGVTADGEPRYFKLDLLSDADSTHGLTRRGVVRLVLPTLDPAAEARPGGVRYIRAPSNDLREVVEAGVGDRPPRLDDPKKAARLVAWLRMRPTGRPPELSLSWVGINAVEIDQRQTLRDRLVGQSDGTADQSIQLPMQSVEAESLQVQVEEEGRGYVAWQRVDDLGLAGRDSPVYRLDAEAGTLHFGDGVRGRIPDAGRRVRVAQLRAGGGRAGNLAPGSLAKIEGLRGPDGRPVSVKLKVTQSLPTEGGEDAETLAQAERRIPSLFRDRDRAVTEQDYHRIAGDTPGVRMGRVAVMPRFKPQQRRPEVPGVVTVMTLPAREGFTPPAPRPDRPFLETVFAQLDARRPLGTELYVIGCEYVPLGLGVGVSVQEGHGRDEVLQGVRDALHRFIWALAPGGHDGTGWELGRAVEARELEVVVARVPGVSRVNGLSLFRPRGDDWDPTGVESIPLERWQLPELLAVVVVDGPAAPTDLRGVPNPFAAESLEGIPVPVVPEVC